LLERFKVLGTHISTEVREIEVTKIPSYGISSFVDMELSALSEFIIRIRIRILGAEMDNLYLESTTVNYYRSQYRNLNRRSGRSVCVIPKYLQSSTVCHKIKCKCPEYRADSHQS
jgi:hypothetical protein